MGRKWCGAGLGFEWIRVWLMVEEFVPGYWLMNSIGYSRLDCGSVEVLGVFRILVLLVFRIMYADSIYLLICVQVGNAMFSFQLKE